MITVPRATPQTATTQATTQEAATMQAATTQETTIPTISSPSNNRMDWERVLHCTTLQESRLRICHFMLEMSSR